MLFKIKNTGLIESAAVRLDGLSVIGGEADVCDCEGDFEV